MTAINVISFFFTHLFPYSLCWPSKIISTVDGDTRLTHLWPACAEHAPVASWHLIETFTPLRYRDSERCMRQTAEQKSLCIRVSGVSWRPLVNVSPGRLRRAIQTCYLSASTDTGSGICFSCSFKRGNVDRCVDCRHWQAHRRCM